jgi:hypothetical protein
MVPRGGAVDEREQVIQSVRSDHVDGIFGVDGKREGPRRGHGRREHLRGSGEGRCRGAVHRGASDVGGCCGGRVLRGR